MSTTRHEYSTGPFIGASHFAKDYLADLLLVHASDGPRISQHYTKLSPSTSLPSETESLAAKLQHPGTFILTCFYPRDPSIQIIPTLGPKVCRYYLQWATWIPRVTSRAQPLGFNSATDTLP